MDKRNYFITSERLGFSKWKPEYFSFAKRLWGSIEVTRFIDARGELDYSQIEEKLKLEISNQKEYGVQYYPIFLLKEDEFIGCCGLRPYNIKNHIFEIGCHILPKYWKKGYAFESVKRMVEFAFKEKQADKLFAGHNPNNEASKRLLTKLGFIYVRDEYFKPTGLNHPSYILERN